MGKVRSRRQGLSILLIFALVFSLLPMLVAAEDGDDKTSNPVTVTFFIYDSVSKDVYNDYLPIEGAQIIVKPVEKDEENEENKENNESSVTENVYGTTNSEGKASFGLKTGEYTYSVTANGYVAKTDGTFSLSEEDKELTIEVGLRKSSSSDSDSSDDSDKTKNIVASQGGSITYNGVTVDIPANAFDEDFKITIEKLSSTSSLPFATNQHLVSDVFEITKDKKGKFSKPVTITLPFKKSKVDFDKQDVALFWLDEDEEEWVELDNNKVNTSTEKVSGEVDHFTKFAVLATDKQIEEEPGEKPEVKLTDIAGHWAEAQIKELVEKGAINGYPDGTFRPNKTITRAEFAKILVHAFDLEAKEGKVFLDTANHWAREDIATATAHDIVRGHNAYTFAPDELITREQMAVMIARALNLEAKEASATFTDRGRISYWAINAVNAAVEAEIIEGYPNNSFMPKGKATRAEAVTIIVKALKHNK